MEKVLDSEPTKASNLAINRWKDIMSPLSVTEIIANCNLDLNELDSNDIRVMRLIDKDTCQANWYYDIGMIDQVTFMKQGTCRRVQAGGSFWEGMYRNDKLNGFGRYVSANL